MAGAGASGPDGGRAGRPASVAAIAASFAEGGFLPFEETWSIRGSLEQAPIVDAKPTLPATRSS